MLRDAYSSVGNFNKALEILERAFDIVKMLPSNSYGRVVWEANVNAGLGRYLLSGGQTEKAIDALSLSVRLSEVRLAQANSMRAWGLINTGRITLVQRLTFLGNAYRAAGRPQEALEQYQRAIDFVRNWGMQYPFENELHTSIGEVHLKEKDFPRALESFQTALRSAEGQQRPDAISAASAGIGDIFRRTGKAGEAIPYYQKAIQRIESTRSLLQSEKSRQSYFEGGLRVYVNMMRTLLSAGKEEEAFNYNERARSRAFLDLLGTKVNLSRKQELIAAEIGTCQ